MIENDWRRRNAIKVEYLHNQRTGTPIQTQEQAVVDARHRIEDLKMAKELGISIEDLDK